MIARTKLHPVVIVAVALWIITGAVAAIEWRGISLRQIIALVALSTAMSSVGLAMHSKRLTVVGTNRVTKFVGRAIVRAPRQARWAGYGEGVEDVLRSIEETSPNLRRGEDTTGDLIGRSHRT